MGLGGLGCPAAQFLATSGVGKLVLNDFDRVDETNLPRQILYTADDVGKLKVEAAGDAPARTQSAASTITALPERLDAAALDAAVGERGRRARRQRQLRDALRREPRVRRRRQAARVGCRRAARRADRRCSRTVPDEPCYSCLYDDEDEWLGDCQGNGVLAPVPGVIGTMMAAEALKLLLGWDSALHNRLLLWDAKRGDWQSVALRRDPDCEVCRAG